LRHPTGSDLARVSKGEEPVNEPVDSPDGRSIAFHRDGRICTMGPDGSEVEALTRSPTGTTSLRTGLGEVGNPI
jgi:hypothetical protein